MDDPNVITHIAHGTERIPIMREVARSKGRADRITKYPFKEPVLELVQAGQYRTAVFQALMQFFGFHWGLWVPYHAEAVDDDGSPMSEACFHRVMRSACIFNEHHRLGLSEETLRKGPVRSTHGYIKRWIEYKAHRRILSGKDKPWLDPEAPCWPLHKAEADLLDRKAKFAAYGRAGAAVRNERRLEQRDAQMARAFDLRRRGYRKGTEIARLMCEEGISIGPRTVQRYLQEYGLDQ